MALKIRLRQQGRNNRQSYRVVVVDARAKRDGKYLEKLGWYQPYLSKESAFIQPERIKYWLEKGAQISPQVESLVRQLAPDVIRAHKEQQQAQRVKRAAKRRALKKAT